MSRPSFSPIRAQLADHLREELSRGRWMETMPGRDRLAEELGMNRKTVEAALNLLEKEGLLVPQGAGRRRRIVLPQGGLETPPLRVAILEDYSAGGDVYHTSLRQLLSDAGHEVSMPRQTFKKLEMDSRQLVRMANRTPADAWVVIAGSRPVLEWFAERPEPVFALFGSRRGLPIAGSGPDHIPAMRTAVQRLAALGHHRIVLLAREVHRVQPLGKFAQSFLGELEAQGLPTGRYNLPVWQENSEGLRQCLESLFKFSPPSALIIDEPYLLAAVQQHLARRGILAPNHVSLVCIDNDPTFTWLEPSVAHLAWDPGPVMRRVARWADNVARGKDDRCQSFTKARFVDGGTVGPAPATR